MSRPITSWTNRNKRRRKAYKATGRPEGRPRKYFNGRKDGHHFRLIGGRGGSKWAY